MALIHQIIPERHARSFIEQGLYFAECESFVDQLEFRLAYCHDASGLAWPDLQPCVAKSFGNELVNRMIGNTAISCWIRQSQEKYWMWELYGAGLAALRISVDDQVLTRHVERTTGFSGVAGPVRYGLGKTPEFITSMVRPEFLQRLNSLPAEEEKHFHLFFQKHDFYAFETELRIVLFRRGP